jgi:biopolymer transport protein ExbD
MAKRRSRLASKIDINMTPMIDVVFQLLTFFMLTLKTVIVEGDFNIKMPLGAAAGAAEEIPLPPLQVRMTATPEGRLAGVRLGERTMVDQQLLEELAGTDAAIEAALPNAKADPAGLAAAQRARQVAIDALVATLQAGILDTFGNDPAKAEEAELELDCDPGLKYDYVVSAITAASGIVQGDEVIPLIQKIKFSPPPK